MPRKARPKIGEVVPLGPRPKKPRPAGAPKLGRPKGAQAPKKPRKPKGPPVPRNGGLPIIDVDLENLPDDLTPLQKRFVQEYLVDLSPAKAYLRAGFARCSDQMASSKAIQLIRIPKVATAIEVAFRKKTERVKIDQDRVVKRLQEEGDWHGDDASHAARVTAWKEIGKLLGFYPEQKTTNVNVLVAGLQPGEVALSPWDLTDLSLEEQESLYKAREAIVAIAEKRGMVALNLPDLVKRGEAPGLKMLPAPLDVEFIPAPEVLPEAVPMEVPDFRSP